MGDNLKILHFLAEVLIIEVGVSDLLLYTIAMEVYAV